MSWPNATELQSALDAGHYWLMVFKAPNGRSHVRFGTLNYHQGDTTQIIWHPHGTNRQWITEELEEELGPLESCTRIDRDGHLFANHGGLIHTYTPIDWQLVADDTGVFIVFTFGTPPAPLRFLKWNITASIIGTLLEKLPRIQQLIQSHHEER